MNTEIIKRFKNFNNPDQIKRFFVLLRQLIEKLGLGPDDPRLALNVRNDSRKRISVNVNSRLVLMLSEGKSGNQLGFMIYSDDKATLQGEFGRLDLTGEEFEPIRNMDDAEIITIPADAQGEIVESIFKTSLKCIEDYLPRATRSLYRKHHIPDLYELASDPQRLDDELMFIEVGDKASSMITDIMARMQSQIQSENHPIERHLWKNKGKARFRQISAFDADDARNNWNMHYELLLSKASISVEFHFEDNGVVEDAFNNVIQQPELESLEKKPWFRGKFGNNQKLVVHGHPFTLDSDTAELASKLSEDLKFLYDKIQPLLNRTINKKENRSAMALNTILYGPPGTGKTYNTINKAISIADPEFNFNQPREVIIARYKELEMAGQIVFTTFHQSMSYEDFVEGIKPLPPDENSGEVNYGIQKGIFRQICEEAQKTSNHFVKKDGKRIPLSESLFEEIYDAVVESLPNQDQENSDFQLFTKENYPFKLFRNKYSIVVKSGAMKSNNSVTANQLKRILFENMEPFYASYDPIILKWILEQHEYSQETEDNKRRNFVLIIDEINRGNVSQIFGELITLIEDDKRIGCPESLQVTLPYSKTKFGVPRNIHIVGTMNTADRSVEALDTALRRRFVFEEKVPDPKLLKPGKLFWDLLWTYHDKEWEDRKYSAEERELLEFLGCSTKIWDERKAIWDRWEKAKMNPEQATDFPESEFSGFRIDLMLDAINKRIEVLVDRDHQVGHAYFINVRTEEQLRSVFENKIIPLLQEYFFGDFGKIGLVLGSSFVERANLGNNGLFSINGYDNELRREYERRTYFRLTDPKQWNFKDIYDTIKPQQITEEEG